MDDLDEQTFVAHFGEIAPVHTNIGEILRPDLSSFAGESDCSLSQGRLAAGGPQSLSRARSRLRTPIGRRPRHSTPVAIVYAKPRYAILTDIFRAYAI